MIQLKPQSVPIIKLPQKRRRNKKRLFSTHYLASIYERENNRVSGKQQRLTEKMTHLLLHPSISFFSSISRSPFLSSGYQLKHILFIKTPLNLNENTHTNTAPTHLLPVPGTDGKIEKHAQRNTRSVQMWRNMVIECKYCLERLLRHILWNGNKEKGQQNKERKIERKK